MDTKPTPTIALEKQVFRGNCIQRYAIELPETPPWRQFPATNRADSGALHESSDAEITAVNMAIYLRRPLLVMGKPGVGKTSLANAVAHELNLGEVLLWPITSRSTLQQGQYHYDAIARLQDASAKMKQSDSHPSSSDIGRYLKLGPLGTAFACSEPNKPRVLLIDEIDKSDLDLPNDLLHIFERGEFTIPELERLAEYENEPAVKVRTERGDEKVLIERGRVPCREFPIVLLTSNGERDFPMAFMRRCVRLDIQPPDLATITRIVERRLGGKAAKDPKVKALIQAFVNHRDQEKRQVATDQLLNAINLLMQGLDVTPESHLGQLAFRDLSDSGS